MLEPPADAEGAWRELVAAEKSRPDPLPEVGERVFARLSASLGLPPSAGDAAASASKANGAPDPGRPSARRILTVVLGAALGATTLGTIAHLRGKAQPAPPTEMRASPPIEPAAPAPAPDAETKAGERPSIAPPAEAQGRADEPGPAQGDARDTGLAAERRLIEDARTSLTRGLSEEALATLRHHARAFPRGRLAEERESLLVQALITKGRYAQARQRAELFERKYPKSLFQPIVEEALRAIP
jgi:TolA-binding protein